MKEGTIICTIFMTKGLAHGLTGAIMKLQLNRIILGKPVERLGHKVRHLKLFIVTMIGQLHWPIFVSNLLRIFRQLLINVTHNV